MIKNPFPFFQKKIILFCLLIICLILATLFFAQFFETEKKQKNYHKAGLSIKIKKTSEKAQAFFSAGKYDSAYFYFNKTQLLCDPKENYADYYVGSLNYMVEILQRYGNYYEAEATLIKGFPYLEKTTSAKYAINAYTFMGYNYLNTYDYENALYYHKKALKKAISTFRKSRILSEIAFVYMQQKKYREAINLLEPIVKYKIEDKITPSKTNYQRSAILYNLGLCYVNIGNHKEEALKCFNESQDLAFTLNDDYELISNYFAFYLYYSKYYNPKLKKLNAEKAYYFAKKAKSATNEINMLAILIEADNAENSRKHWKAYIKKSDSLIVSRKKAKNQFADAIYNSKKDREENLELKTQKAEKELQLESEKNRSYILSVVISISALVLIFLAFYITYKAKKEKDDAVFKSEMRISDKLQNELTKDIHQILEFTKNNELEDLRNKEKFLSNLNAIYSKTRSISRENNIIYTDHTYDKDLREMISSYTTSNLNIIINGLNTLSWSKIDRVKKITAFRVIQEIFEQMKTLNNASLASITFKKFQKKIIITYTDNGTKFNGEQSILEKRLQNVENRIETIKGTINFDANSESGFKISIKFPI